MPSSIQPSNKKISVTLSHFSLPSHYQFQTKRPQLDSQFQALSNNAIKNFCDPISFFITFSLSISNQKTTVRVSIGVPKGVSQIKFSKWCPGNFPWSNGGDQGRFRTVMTSSIHCHYVASTTSHQFFNMFSLTNANDFGQYWIPMVSSIYWNNKKYLWLSVTLSHFSSTSHHPFHFKRQ